MTVTELIERLRSYPQDAEIVIENTDAYFNGYYPVTDVDDFDNGMVLIFSNHDEIVDIMEDED